VNPFERLRRFRPRGVFWRHYLAWAVNNVPWFLETPTMIGWTLLFYLFWAPGRRAVTENLCAIHPGSPRFVNRLRAFRVFLAFAWNFTDAARFSERKTMVDWEFEGIEHLRELACSDRGAIILTAHMGNYDLGSYLFAQKFDRRITVVRVPEVDPESEEYSRTLREKVADGFTVRYNTGSRDIALDLFDALRDGGIVAIQGDRALKGMATRESRLFQRQCRLPTGPFVLAMATRAPIYPLFVTRVGLRRYRIITLPPMTVERTGRDRDRDIAAAIDRWRPIVEEVIREHWTQWFAFEPFAIDEAAS